MNIESKVNIGSKVYFLKKIKKEICPVCCGRKKIVLSNAIQFTGKSEEEMIESVANQISQSILDSANGIGKQYDCPECKGKGFVKVSGKPKYVVAEGTVVSINAFTDERHSYFTYEVNDNNCVRKMTDEDICVSREGAEKRCKFLNLERRLVPIECVQIPDYFNNTLPCDEKLMCRLDEWRRNGKFDNEIYVDKNLKLFDGYTSFLVYRMLGIIDIPVVIWEDKAN